MLSFRFNEQDLEAVLALWAERQQANNPELMDHHVEYMTNSARAILYSEEGKLLREETDENKESTGQ